MSDGLRGHPIYQDEDGSWRYVDTNAPTALTWRERECGHCGLMVTDDGHDGCIGKLPGVINACCGHGLSVDAYIQFENKEIIRGHAVEIWISKQQDISM